MELFSGEEEIKSLLASAKVKTPTREMLRNFEQEVFIKIRAQEAAPFIPWPAVALSLTVVACILLVWFFAVRPAARTMIAHENKLSQIETEKNYSHKNSIDAEATDVETVPTEVKVLEAPKAIQITPTSIPEVREESKTIPPPDQKEVKFKRLENDMFILEMLGEDEGIADNFERVSSDIDLIGQISPSVG